MLAMWLAAILAGQAASSGEPRSDLQLFVEGRVVSTVQVTRSGNVRCALRLNGRDLGGQHCSVAGPVLNNMRGLHKNAQLTLIQSAIPGETGDEVDPARGELIVEGRARLSLGADGRVAACEIIADRVLRQVAGVRRSPAFCERYTVGTPAFAATATGAPRVLTISALVYWRED